MFNGSDLTGWWTPGTRRPGACKDGNLALVGGGGNYLRSEKEYGNFTLSLEYKIRKRGNSGVGIRTAKNGWPSSDGMELQIEDSRKLDASATMAIYRNIEPIALAEKTEDWNHAVIKADGRMISAWLNGVLVQQVNTQFLPEVRHRPLKGWIGFQDHGAPIQFRNLRIIEAPDGLGLDAWCSTRQEGPRTEPAAHLVLDRLMNPERLTLRDGSISARRAPRSARAASTCWRISKAQAPWFVSRVRATPASWPSTSTARPSRASNVRPGSSISMCRKFAATAIPCSRSWATKKA